MASQVVEQLKTPVPDTYARFSMYMLAKADERRTQLIAQAFVLIYVFDGKWLAHPSYRHVPNVFTFAGRTPRLTVRVEMWEKGSTVETLRELREGFVARLTAALPDSETETPLQQRMREIRKGFLESDEEGGNGGSDVLQHLIEFCHHPPIIEHACVLDYLNYRWEDAAHG
ncbi:MAG: hypothetical protein Q9191_002603 [Dirinaria sp. TL-2023a]